MDGWSRVVISAIQKVNEAKARLLYQALDSSDFWKPVAQVESRSIMNVAWRLDSEELEKQFISEADKKPDGRFKRATALSVVFALAFIMP